MRVPAVSVLPSDGRVGSLTPACREVAGLLHSLVLPDGDVAITDKIYLKNHRQIASQLEVNIPKGAFKGATIEVLYSGEGLAKVDDATRERLLDFAEDFLDCEDPDDLYTGYPERQFIRYLLDLRAQGLGPDAIVDVMADDYMLYAYPGDVLSFLDDAVRTLEAVESLADVEGNAEMSRRAAEARQALQG